MAEIEITGLKTAQKALANWEATATPIFFDAMDAATQSIVADAVPRAPVGVSGALRNSLASEVLTEGSEIVGKVGSNMKSEVYPATMEYGRAAGTMPPPSALERWVHLKLGVPTKQAKGVAFVIARKIAARGIAGKRFLRDAIDAQTQNVNAIFAAALDKLAEALAHGSK